MIAIIDYGLGNVLAFKNVFNRLNVPVAVAKSPNDLAGATRLILPGVGSFDYAMKEFDRSGLREAVEHLVLGSEIPILGVCVGMQMLARSSDEGESQGLGWIDADVKKFDTSRMQRVIHLPHMGWNDVIPLANGNLFQGLEEGARFYFLHSYYFQCHNPTNVLATSGYGVQFSSAVRRNNIYGVQFHPEKSHQFGSQLLKNFAEL
jgi:glutamine amidotransferase